MCLLTDLRAAEDVVMMRGLPTWVKLRGRMLAVAALLVCLLPACSTPEKSTVAGLKIPPKARYTLKVSELVDKQWRHDLAQTQGRPYAAFGGMEVGYWVNKKGKVERMRVVGAKGASPDLLSLTQNAIQKVKLPRMPAEVARALTAKEEGCLRLVYKAYIPPPGKSGLQVAGLTAAERAALETRVAWNKAHATNQVGFVSYTEAEKITGLNKETPTSRYGKLVIGRVKRQWYLNLVKRPYLPAGELDVVFSVNSAGKVVSPEATLPKGCDPRLKELLLITIQEAEIPPMPAEVRRALSGSRTGCLKFIFHGRNH